MRSAGVAPGLLRDILTLSPSPVEWGVLATSESTVGCPLGVGPSGRQAPPRHSHPERVDPCPREGGSREERASREGAVGCCELSREELGGESLGRKETVSQGLEEEAAASPPSQGGREQGCLGEGPSDVGEGGGGEREGEEGEEGEGGRTEKREGVEEGEEGKGKGRREEQGGQRRGRGGERRGRGPCQS